MFISIKIWTVQWSIQIEKIRFNIIGYIKCNSVWNISKYIPTYICLYRYIYELINGLLKFPYIFCIAKIIDRPDNKKCISLLLITIIYFFNLYISLYCQTNTSLFFPVQPQNKCSSIINVSKVFAFCIT